MSSLAAQPEPLPGLLIWIIPTASLLICWRLGIFSPVSNPLDRRLGKDESPLGLLLVLVMGTMAGYVATLLAMGALHVDPKVTPLRAHAILLSLVFVSLLAVRVISQRDGIERLGLSPLRFVSAIPWSVVAILLTLPLVLASGALILAIWKFLELPEPSPHPILQELLKEGNVKRISFLVIVVTVLAPLAEETFFRALLQTSLSRISRMPWAAILVTSALFAAVHGELAFMVPLFILGVGLGWVYERTGNLWATIMMHGLFNGFQVLAFLKWPHA